MKIERAIEILNPEHREAYDDLEEVNEACRMGMLALRIIQAIEENETGRFLPAELRGAAETMRRGINSPAQRATINRAAHVLEAIVNIYRGAAPGREAPRCTADTCIITYPDDDMTRRSGLLEEE